MRDFIDIDSCLAKTTRFLYKKARMAKTSLTVATLVALLSACSTTNLSPEVIVAVHTTTMLEWVQMMMVLCQLLRKEAKKVRKDFLNRYRRKMAQYSLHSVDQKQGEMIMPSSVFSHMHIHDLHKALQTLETLLFRRDCEYKENDKWLVMFFKEFIPTPQNVELYMAFVDVKNTFKCVITMLNQISVEYSVDHGAIYGQLPLPYLFEPLRLLFNHLSSFSCTYTYKSLDFKPRNNFTPLCLLSIHTEFPVIVGEDYSRIPRWIRMRTDALFPNVDDEEIRKIMGLPPMRKD